MKEKLLIVDFQDMLRNALSQISECADKFSTLDAVLGDGDHGTAIVQAMTALVDSAEKGKAFSQMLESMGMDIMMQISGSTSTLLGAFFLGMSNAVPGGLTELDAREVQKMFEGGLNGVKGQTKATRGDKTMMDALLPAIETILSQDTPDIKEIMEAGASAAMKGAEATIGMKANFGRARNYGERSIGHADPGASSWACMFDAFAKAI